MTDQASDRRPFPPSLTDHERRIVLRRALVSALRAGRHEGLVDVEASTTQRPVPQIAANAAVIAMLWALGATAGSALGLSPWWWIPCSIGVLFALVALSQIAVLSPRIGYLVLFAVIGSAMLQASTSSLWMSHLGPAIAVVILALLTHGIDVRSARDLAVSVAAIARSAPLLGPLVLVVLVLPALSNDLWRAAAILDAWDISVLVLVAVLPLGLLVLRQLVVELPVVLQTRAEELAQRPQKEAGTRKMLEERLAADVFEFVDAAASGTVSEAWPAAPREYADVIAASERSTLYRPLQVRLALCVVAVALVLAAYLYVVLAAIVDPSVARQWSGERVPIWNLDLAGVQLSFPGGIYLQVVAMLGVLATATFLAFALLEERFSNALGDALLRLPADRLLYLALPYLQLREESIQAGDDALDMWDPGAATKEVPSTEAEPSQS